MSKGISVKVILDKSQRKQKYSLYYIVIRAFLPESIWLKNTYKNWENRENQSTAS